VMLSFLASCSEGAKGNYRLLNADDVWDKMTSARDMPVPAADAAPELNSDVGSEAMTSDTHIGSPLTSPSENLDAYHQTLEMSQAEYDVLDKNFETDIRALNQVSGTKNEKKIIWRTTQLHLSRLINLQKVIKRAMSGLDAGEVGTTGRHHALRDSNKALLRTIEARITTIQNRLDSFIFE